MAAHSLIGNLIVILFMPFIVHLDFHDPVIDGPGSTSHLESPKEAERHLLEMVRQCSFLLLLFIP